MAGGEVLLALIPSLLGYSTQGSEWCSFCVASLTRGLALASGYATIGALIRVVPVTLAYTDRVDAGRQVVSNLIVIIGGSILGERHRSGWF